MQLTPEQIAQFWRDGFLHLPNFIDSAAVDSLSAQYDRFLNREIDAGENDRLLGGVTRQIMHAHLYHPYFETNPALEAGYGIARQLLSAREVMRGFDMLISKPPGSTNATPWHQDWSYAAMPFAPAGTPIVNENLQFWVAMDDVDEQNGCMHFIPGVHQGTLLEHYVASGSAEDVGRLLGTDKADASRAVACPLPAGGCTIHTMGTPHYTSGNLTADRRRRAYIFNIKAA